MTISKRKADKCVTHHFSCDCREYKMQEMEKTLKLIYTWAAMDSERNLFVSEKALQNKRVMLLCDKALRCLDDKKIS